MGEPHYLMKWFAFAHLPQGIMRDTSEGFHKLAQSVDIMLVDGSEKSAALRHLLEAKDAAVRAAKETSDGGTE